MTQTHSELLSYIGHCMEKLSNISQECMEDFIAAAQRAARYGLVVCGSGNLSLKIDSKRMLITTSGAWMEEMSDDQITVGKDFRDALQKATFFEFACGILLQAGDKIQTIPEKAISVLFDARKNYSQPTQAV